MNAHIILKVTLAGFLFILIPVVGRSQQNISSREIDRYTAGKEERLGWMNEARFGMFIHWGVYSLTSDEWEGQRYTGESCFVMQQAKIPREEYLKKVAGPFNPIKFNADEWVQIAKKAGMKYIIVTAKHVDGFAMYHSRVSPLNIVDGTAYQKDPIRELKEACDKHDMRLGFYYSQHWDWLHPHALAQSGKDIYWDNNWDWPDRTKKDPDIYYEEKAYKQVEELVAGYDPSIIWFDVPGSITPEQSFNLLKIVRSIRPDCIINNRIGNDLGDYGTPEQLIPKDDQEFFEVCMTIRDHWGYSFFDRNFKSAERLIQNLVDIASKGGNYLLNVGPTSEGIIPQPSVRVLEEIGDWMQVNGESIYGTSASPLGRLPFEGRCTMKPGQLFIHIFEWPIKDQIIIPGIRSKIKKIYFLGDEGKKPLEYSYLNQENLCIVLNSKKAPTQAINAHSTVLVVEYTGDLETRPTATIVDAASSSILDPIDAVIKGNTLNYSFNPVWGRGRGYQMNDWYKTDETVEWKFTTIREGEFDIELSYGAVDACRMNEFVINVGQQEIRSVVRPTGDWYDFQKHVIGGIQLREPGEYTLTIRPLKTDGCSLMNLQSVRLLPIIR